MSVIELHVLVSPRDYCFIKALYDEVRLFL